MIKNVNATIKQRVPVLNVVCIFVSVNVFSFGNFEGNSPSVAEGYECGLCMMTDRSLNYVEEM